MNGAANGFVATITISLSTWEELQKRIADHEKLIRDQERAVQTACLKSMKQIMEEADMIEDSRHRAEMRRLVHECKI